MTGRRSDPRTNCPECDQQVTVIRSTERIRRHKHDGAVCPGTGRQVDLYEPEKLPDGTRVTCPVCERGSTLDRQRKIRLHGSPGRCEGSYQWVDLDNAMAVDR